MAAGATEKKAVNLDAVDHTKNMLRFCQCDSVKCVSNFIPAEVEITVFFSCLQ